MSTTHPVESRKLDLATWPRREHFNFFRTFEEPYWGVCVTLDCTAAYHFVKQRGISFFLYCLHRSLAAAQQVEVFRYRIEGDEVLIYDRIDAGSVIDRPDGTFSFGHLPFCEHLENFIATATREIERIRSTTGLAFTPANNLIRYSVLPWLDFTSLSHARMFSRADTCPRITFGKMTEQDGKRTMPVSIHVHHALVDGLHVGQYVETLQRLMDAPPSNE